VIKRIAIAVLAFLYALFIFWIDGGVFERGGSLAAIVLAATALSIMAAAFPFEE